METPFINDMYSVFYEAFHNICPDKKVYVQWVNEIDPLDGEELAGVTRFRDDEAIDIEILTKQSVAESVETFIHELAHVIVGPKNEHGEEFEKARELLIKEYDRIFDEKFPDCLAFDISVTDEE